MYLRLALINREARMAKKAKKQTSRGRKQDQARVAGGQDYEVQHKARKTGKPAASVKRAVKKVGNSRTRVERRLGPAIKKSLGKIPSK